MKSMLISKTLFVLLCLLLAASAAMAADHCTGHLWSADINGDCVVQYEDFAILSADFGAGAPVPILDLDNIITFQAEDCILGGDYKLDTGPNSVIVAAVGGAHINAIGTASFTMPAEIPAGEYVLRVQWLALNQGGVENGAFNINGVTENGGNGAPGDWHSFGPPAGTSGFFLDELAGPSMGVGATSMINGWEVKDAWGAFATSLTIAAGNNGNVTIEILDESATPNYAIFIVDYFEFVPVIIPPDPAIYIQAEDCILGGDYKLDTSPNSVIVASFGDEQINAFGTASFTMPAEIPAGEYTLSVRWLALNQGGTENGAFNISGVTENGANGANGDWRHFRAPAGTSGFFLDELAGPSMGVGATEMINGWIVSDLTGAFATSITIAPGNNGNITIEIDDKSPTPNYALYIIDYFKFEPVVDLPGDLDNNRTVDPNDLSILVDQWLNCNDPNDPACLDIFCNSKPAIGATEYTAYVPDGPVVIDGNLDDWPAFDYTEETWCSTSKWVALDRLYFGTPNFIEDMYMCIMYDAATDMVYGAVIAKDFDPDYGPTIPDWDAQDSIEIYIQGDVDKDANSVPFGVWSNAQQYMVGLEADETTTYMQWPTADFVSGPDPGLNAVAARVVNGVFDHDLIYEFAAVPYDNYGGFDASTTVQSDLFSGKQFGFDIVLDNYSPFSGTYSQHAANWLATPPGSSKAYIFNLLGVVTCE